MGCEPIFFRRIQVAPHSFSELLSFALLFLTSELKGDKTNFDPKIVPPRLPGGLTVRLFSSKR